MKNEVDLIDKVVDKAAELFRAESAGKSFDASYYGGVNRGLSLIKEAYKQIQADTEAQSAVKYKENTKKSEGRYRIYMSSAAGLSYTGVTASSEEEAIDLCNKYDAGRDCTYCKHVYKKV